MSWGDRGERDVGWGGGVFGWEKEKIEDVLGWGLYLGERKYWGCTGVRSLSGRKKKLRMYWGGVFIWRGKKTNWGYTEVGSLSGRMTNWGCTGVGFYLWEKKLRMYWGGVFIWEKEKNWGCTGVGSLSGRNKLSMYWGGVFIWRGEKNWGYTEVGSLSGRMTNWGCTGAGFYLWERKKMRMYWGGVFIREKEKTEDVLGWGLFGKQQQQQLRMYLWWSLYTLYFLHACQVRITVGGSGLCCCMCVTYSEGWLLPCLLISMWKNSGSVHCKEIPLLAPVMHTRGRICRDQTQTPLFHYP